MILRAGSASELEAQLAAAGAAPLQSVVPLPDGRVFVVQSAAGSTALPARSDLSDEQANVVAAVTGGSGDILVIAGPGSGKTKTLIASVVAAVQNGVPPEAIAAITFTNNAAAELQVRLVEEAKKLGLPGLLRVHVSTFHAWAGQLAVSRIAPWTFPPVNLRPASLAVALHLTNPDTATHNFTKTEVMAADRHLEGCETFEEMEERNFNKIGPQGSTGTNRTGFDNLVKAVTDLEGHLTDSQIETYGTLMRSATTSVGSLQPKSLRWLFIDEAQDLNRPQAEFVDAARKQTGCRVFAIADDDQGIYKFRGASSQFLRDFGKRPTTQTYPLTRNFRSTIPIVALCRKWIEPNWSTLGSPKKELHSEREGLPVVVLTAQYPKARGCHAKIILEAAKKTRLIHHLGEVATLGYSPNNVSFDLKESGLKFRSLADRRLPDKVLKAWQGLCRGSKSIDDWHHPLWMEFLEKVTDDQIASGDAILGHPGLADLYAALEAARRIQPGLTPPAFTKVIEEINRGRTTDGEKFFFLGDRPEPDYAADAVNYISLHSSKGMEFPVVWVTGGGFTLAVSDSDETQGQPGVLGELGEWAKTAAAKVNSIITGSGKPNPAEYNKVAAALEKRRLLYVGMSRATDLLIISAPLGSGKNKKNDTDFKAEIEEILTSIEHCVISTDAQARTFAAKITAAHRHPTWTPPHRHRVESFTSLTRQPQPGEVLETEIPREREFPRPQSHDAMIGDLFHLIMHLLCLEPDTLAARLLGRLTNAHLITRVSTRPATELATLASLLESYFSDVTNQPWTWLANARSEVPFSHVTSKSEIGKPPVSETTEDSKDETCLLKGFFDLVKFNASGQPVLIVDYKTGSAPITDSPDDLHHAAQMHCYRDALAASYSCDPAGIALTNYYIVSQKVRNRR